MKLTFHVVSFEISLPGQKALWQAIDHRIVNFVRIRRKFVQLLMQRLTNNLFNMFFKFYMTSNYFFEVCNIKIDYACNAEN